MHTFSGNTLGLKVEQRSSGQQSNNLKKCEEQLNRKVRATKRYLVGCLHPVTRVSAVHIIVAW